MGRDSLDRNINSLYLRKSLLEASLVRTELCSGAGFKLRPTLGANKIANQAVFWSSFAFTGYGWTR